MWHMLVISILGVGTSWETSPRYSYTMYQKPLHPGLLVQAYNPNYAGRSKVQALPWETQRDPASN